MTLCTLDSRGGGELVRKPESGDTQDHDFYLYMARFYEEKGDLSRANWAIRKAAYHQLFPPALE